MDLDQYLFGTWITAPDLSSNVEDGDINCLASAVQELEIREHEAHRLICNHQNVIPKLQELVNCGLDRFNHHLIYHTNQLNQATETAPRLHDQRRRLIKQLIAARLPESTIAQRRQSIQDKMITKASTTIRIQAKPQEVTSGQAVANEDQNRRTAVLADLLKLVNLKNIKKPKLNQCHLTIINLLLPPMLTSVKQPSSNVNLRATTILPINKYQPKYLKPTNTPNLYGILEHYHECSEGYSSQRVLLDETNQLEYDEDIFYDALEFEEGKEKKDNNETLAEVSIEEMFDDSTTDSNNLASQFDRITGPDTDGENLEDIKRENK